MAQRPFWRRAADAIRRPVAAVNRGIRRAFRPTITPPPEPPRPTRPPRASILYPPGAEPIQEAPPSPEPVMFPTEETLYEPAPTPTERLYQPWPEEPEVILYERIGTSVGGRPVYGDSVGSMSFDEWYGELLRTGPEFREQYGITHWEAIRQLHEQGYWDDSDWENWSELYDQIYG